MTIWRYEALSRVSTIAVFFARECIFCGSHLTLYSDASGSVQLLDAEPSAWRSGSKDDAIGATTYTQCPLCGWWTVLHSEEMESRRGPMAVHRGAVGALKDIDSIDVRMPLDEIQQYLIAKWEARSVIDWRLLEETVGDVFSSLGFEVRVTARSGDGGIDASLSDSAGVVIGVQVKRSKKKIVADQIRSFLGALMTQDITRGIFVTTSTYQAGAEKVATLAESRGHAIELMDGDAFYDAIGIARLQRGSSPLAGLPTACATRRLWRTPIL